MTLMKKNGNGNGNQFPFSTSDFFNKRFWGPNLLNFTGDWPGLRTPPANFTESKDEFRIDLSVPGMKREDFEVEVENGNLTISCEKKEESKEEKDNYTRREFSYESFSRSFPLPENSVEEEIHAKYDNGMLKISIPKKEPSPLRGKKAIQVA